MMRSTMAVVFWVSVFSVWYAYLGYPLTLWIAVRLFRRPAATWHVNLEWAPSVTMIIPVHNERDVIEEKIRNTLALLYPVDRLRVLIVADGCTDGTTEILRRYEGGVLEVLEVQQRGGKAGALNAALEHAANDILVFSDASILLDAGALSAVVQPFQDGSIGCVSGEDHIPSGGGEALYGRYELWIRRLECRMHSIAGASGSFYAQRRPLCAPFAAGLAPDFLSVLRTVEQGYRAVAVAEARGTMRATTRHRDEFERKARTLLRGMTTLREYAHLMNPFAWGWFAFTLLAHKLWRWLVPLFLISAVVSAALLAPRSPFYLALLVAQLVFYASALGAAMPYAPIANLLPVKVAAYFTTVSAATLSAWMKFLAGTRQELWTPTRR